MKKRWIAITCAALSAALLLGGCTKEEPGPEGGVPGAEIVPTASVASADVGVDTKAAVDGSVFPQAANVFRLDAWRGTAAPTGNWTPNHFADQQVNCTAANGTVALNAAQYYPADGTPLWFFAWAPHTTTILASPRQVQWTIDGTQDIMWAKTSAGIGKASAGNQPQPELKFDHKLKKVVFKVTSDATFPGGVSLTSIKVVEQRALVTMDVTTGNVTFAEKTSGGDELTAFSGSQAISTGVTTVGSAMFEPGPEFTVRAVAGGVTYDVLVTLSGTGAGQVGKAHEVTLTFKRKQITATASVTDWGNTVQTNDIEIGADKVQ